MTTYVEATFIGQQDAEFHQKQTYQLQVVQRWNKTFTIVVTHGYNFKPIEDMERSYRGLKNFLQDWRILRVVGPRHDGIGI